MRKLLLLFLVVVGLASPERSTQAQSLGLPGAPGSEQAEASPTIDEAQTRALIETLENPDQRARLVEQLEALLQVAQPVAEEPAAPDDAVGWMLEEISNRTDVVRQVVGTLVQELDEVPVLVDWLERQLVEPTSREVWLWVGYRVGLVLGLGLAAMVAMSFVLRRFRRNLTETPTTDLGDRLARVFLWLIVELMPVVAFAVAAYGTLATLAMENLGRLVVLPLVNAVVVVRSGVALFRVLFAPKAPMVRVLPLADAGAIYVNRWLRRLLATSVYGYFILLAAQRLGLPWTLHGLLLHTLFFVVAIMVMIVIVQRREPVARAIARLGAGEETHSALRRLPWGTLANFWHVLALIYVLSIYLVWALKIPGGFRALIEATLGSAVIVALGWLVWRALDHLFKRQQQQTEDDRETSLIERRLASYLPLLGGASKVVVILMVVLGLFEVWGFGSLTWLFSESGNTVLGNLLTVLIIAAITLGIWEIVSFLIERSITETDAEGNLMRSNRTRTLLNITRNLLLVLLSLIALFLILAELGLDVAPLLAGAGVIGLAIGFGSQKLVQDIITGLFMLLGDTMRVGDVVTLGGKTGIVEEVSMRTVQLRDYGGNVHTIPYSAIDTVTNLTKEFSYAVFDIGVAYKEDVDEVIQALREVGAEMSRDAYFRRLLLEPLEVAGLDQFGASALVIRSRFKTRPLKQWEVSREFNRRVKIRFDQLGIEIPFPHQTVYFGQDKQGRAPPAPLRIERDPATTELEEPPELLVDERATLLRAQSSRG